MATEVHWKWATHIPPQGEEERSRHGVMEMTSHPQWASLLSCALQYMQICSHFMHTGSWLRGGWGGSDWTAHTVSRGSSLTGNKRHVLGNRGMIDGGSFHFISALGFVCKSSSLKTKPWHTILPNTPTWYIPRCPNSPTPCFSHSLSLCFSWFLSLFLSLSLRQNSQGCSRAAHWNKTVCVL